MTQAPALPAVTEAVLVPAEEPEKRRRRWWFSWLA
jgi:hypothetical protein